MVQKWQMNFNVNKCKRFQIGQTNPHNKYTIAGIDLVESDQERDLGIIVDNKLKFHIQTSSSSFVSSNRILPFVYTFSGIFVELLKVIQSAGMC